LNSEFWRRWIWGTTWIVDEFDDQGLMKGLDEDLGWRDEYFGWGWWRYGVMMMNMKVWKFEDDNECLKDENEEKGKKCFLLNFTEIYLIIQMTCVNKIKMK